MKPIQSILNILIIFVVFFSLSCNDDDEITIITPQGNSFFPTSVGTTWTYAVFDSNRNVSFYRVVRVTDIVRIQDTLIGYRWLLSDPYDTTRRIFRISNDTVFEHFPTKEYNYHKILFKSMQLNSLWNVPCGLIRVAGFDSVMTPSGTFNSCTHIFYGGGCFNDYYYEEHMWFKPYIGFVQRSIYQSGFEHVRESWKLKTFSFPN